MWGEDVLSTTPLCHPQIHTGSLLLASKKYCLLILQYDPFSPSGVLKSVCLRDGKTGTNAVDIKGKLSQDSKIRLWEGMKAKWEKGAGGDNVPNPVANRSLLGHTRVWSRYKSLATIRGTRLRLLGTP